MNANKQEVLLSSVACFLETNNAHLVRWTMAFFLLSYGIPQNTIASVTNYSDRHIRNIKNKFKNLDEIFLQPIGKKGRKKKISQLIHGEMIKYIVTHPRAKLKDVARHLKEQCGINVSTKTIERDLEEYNLSDIFTIIRKREERLIHTKYGGGWLLAPFISDLVKKTENAFNGLPGSIETILTLFFLSVFGIERTFHLEDLSDLGFAILTGRNRVLSRTTLFRWGKKCRKSMVLRFYELTRPLEDFIEKDLRISIDEHVVARWTKKVAIPGTKHPTRGKAMRADKLFYIFELGKKRILSFKPKQGSATLANTTLKMVKELFSSFKPKSVRMVLDAGGCKGSVIARFNGIKSLIYLIRAKRYSNLVDIWKKVKKDEYKEYPDPSDPENRTIRIAETRTKIKGCNSSIRTILILDENAEEEKDKFYPIYTNDEDTPAYDLVIEYRGRQNHELCYRVLKHDLNLDALPKSYPLDPKAEKVQFRDKSVILIGWIKALAFNIIGDFKESLDVKYHKMTAGTIVRKFIHRSATINTTADEIVVKFDYFREQDALRAYCEMVNREKMEISWFGDKILRFEFESKEEHKERKSFLSGG